MVTGPAGRRTSRVTRSGRPIAAASASRARLPAHSAADASTDRSPSSRSAGACGSGSGSAPWSSRIAKVRADLEAAAETKAAEAAELEGLTAQQLAARGHHRHTHIPTPPPAKPTGYYPALEAIRAEDKAKESEQHEQRERKLGIPQKQAAWDARRQEIENTRAAAIREAAEACRTSERAARDKHNMSLTSSASAPALWRLPYEWTI
jgi:hypothetical protein